jgi:SRSO17 transposase
LIFPWVSVKNLASCVLASCLRSIRNDWKDAYGIEPKLVETFIDSNRYKGTCYIAANFKRAGETKGYGKRGKKFEFHGVRKQVLLYELDRGFIKSMDSNLQRTVRPAKPEKPDLTAGIRMLLQIPDWNVKLLENIGISPEKISVVERMFWSFLDEFKSCFTRIRQALFFAMIAKGLMSDLPRKSLEPIALRYGKSERSVRNLQNFMRVSPWSDADIHQKYKIMLSGLVSEEDGMITVDGCDFPKKGGESAGVARQHCGPSGKTDNCQASVMVGYSGMKGYGLICHALYMPQKWFNDEYAGRRKICGVPEDAVFRTKNEIAVDLMESCIGDGLFNAKWVGADSAFGHDRKFIDSIPQGLNYFIEVHSSDKFFERMPAVTSPRWFGSGRKPFRKHVEPEAVPARLIVENSRTPWQEVIFSIGSKGPVVGYEKVMRVVDVRDGLPNERIWLYARKLGDGSIKYSISNAPENTPVAKFRDLAMRRWSIEQSFKECKSYLGMDHYESRSWKGWRHHILVVFVLHLFLQVMRNRFKAEVEHLSIHAGEIHKNLHPGDEHRKVAVLTTNMARLIVNAAISDRADKKNSLYRVDYAMKRYAKSFISYFKNFKNKFLSYFIGKRTPKRRKGFCYGALYAACLALVLLL